MFVLGILHNISFQVSIILTTICCKYLVRNIYNVILNGLTPSIYVYCSLSIGIQGRS